MSKEKIYETLYKTMGDCWEWAYDKPEHAVAYFDGLWTMANVMIEDVERLADKLETETDV